MKKKPDTLAEEIRREILQYSHYEHFKAEKDLAMVLPVGHARRKALAKSSNEISALLKNKTR